MNDSEFLELLNLYLDHEITAADAARLESEVQNNAARRAVYRDYCRMQKACRILAVDLQVDGTGAKRSAESGKVVAFELQPTRNLRRVAYILAGSTAVAAACVVFLLTNAPQTSSEAAVSRQNQTFAAKPAIEHPAGTRELVTTALDPSRQRGATMIGLQDPRATSRVSLVADSLVLSGGRQVETALSAAGQEDDDQLAWIRSFQLVSLQERKKLGELRFDVVSPSLRPEGRQLGGRAPAENTVEMTAFRFLK